MIGITLINTFEDIKILSLPSLKTRNIYFQNQLEINSVIRSSKTYEFGQ